MKDKMAISIHNLTKIYPLYDKPQDRFKEALSPFRKSYHRDFYAMKNVDIEIRKGETVGIIGKNGAGKSTLLKMITGVLTPSSGTIEIKGRIASLLELGAGFNPEMTGLENIYLNGTLMGFSDKEMDSKMEAILEFADIGDFIHQPVKMYSSGMFARLAFSVSINVEPDILIIDEALSVGDMAFQMKCFKKFQEFQEQGRTILFVTHALDTVIRYCNRGIVIDNGTKVCDGSSKEAVDLFKRILTGNYDPEQKEERAGEIPVESRDGLLKNTFPANKEMLEYGNKKAKIYDYAILDDSSRSATHFEHNAPCDILLKIQFDEKILSPIFAFSIKDAKGLEITGTNTMMKSIETGTYHEGDRITVHFRQKMNLRSGAYALSLGCVSMTSEGIDVYHRLYDAILFEVISTEEMGGFFDLGSEVTIEV